MTEDEFREFWMGLAGCGENESGFAEKKRL